MDDKDKDVENRREFLKHALKVGVGATAGSGFAKEGLKASSPLPESTNRLITLGGAVAGGAAMHAMRKALAQDAKAEQADSHGDKGRSR